MITFTSLNDLNCLFGLKKSKTAYSVHTEWFSWHQKLIGLNDLNCISGLNASFHQKKFRAWCSHQIWHQNEISCSLNVGWSYSEFPNQLETKFSLHISICQSKLKHKCLPLDTLPTVHYDPLIKTFTSGKILPSMISEKESHRVFPRKVAHLVWIPGHCSSMVIFQGSTHHFLQN